MKTISRFEANLLRLLHFFLRQAPVQQALQLLEGKLDRPPCLSRDAVALVQDALGKGCVLLLTRLGGWRIERHLRDGQVVQGRLWERTPPQQLGLSFSGNTLDFLVWVTAKKTDENKKGWQPVAPLTAGDLVLLYFACEQLRGMGTAVGLLKNPPLDTHGLGWLAFPDDHARAGSTAKPDFRPWVTGVGACVLEALQQPGLEERTTLADRWVQLEVDKGNISGWQQMRDLGQAQERALDAFLKAAETAGRYDLARFLLVAAEKLLTPSVTHELWVKGLRHPAQRLSDRSETYRGALAFLRVLPRLQQWERQARSVGYFDDGYQASQLWKADWERYQGDVLTERAQAIIRHLDPMRQT